MTVVPEMRISDWARLLRNPTEREIDHWIMRGERSVWPHMTALIMRLRVEITLDRGYQLVRRTGRHVALVGDEEENEEGAGAMEVRSARKRKRTRAASTGNVAQ